MATAAGERRANETLLEAAACLAETPAGWNRGGTERRRQCARRHEAAFRGANRQRRQDVLELAHVAGPVMPGEHRDRLRGERGPRTDPFSRRMPEMLGEQRDVIAAIAQRRDRDTDDVEPVQ